jgi:hypothetical protein
MTNRTNQTAAQAAARWGRISERTKMLNRKVVLVLAALLLVPACSDNDEGTPGPTGPDGGMQNPDAGNPESLTLDSLMEQLKQKDRALLATCNGGMPEFYLDFVEKTLDESSAQMAASLAAGRITLDQAKARECLQIFNSLTCEDLLSESVETKIAVCDQIYVPHVAVGGACYVEQECIGGWCKVESCPGACVASALEGQSCDGNQCADGLFCNGSKTCQKPGAAGSNCDWAEDCEAGLECDEGKCAVPAAPGQVGATCGTCASGLYCSRPDFWSDGTCKAILAEGAECGENLMDAMYACGYDLSCYGYVGNSTGATVTKGHCKRDVDVGGTCVPDSDNQTVVTGCKAGLRCVNSVCQEPPQSGPCAEDELFECNPLTSYCDESTQCVALKADGVACTGSNECESGVCDQVCKEKCKP